MKTEIDLSSGKYLKLWQGPQHPGITGNMSLELTVCGDEVIDRVVSERLCVDQNIVITFDTPQVIEILEFLQCPVDDTDDVVDIAVFGAFRINQGLQPQHAACLDLDFACMRQGSTGTRLVQCKTCTAAYAIEQLGTQRLAGRGTAPCRNQECQ